MDQSEVNAAVAYVNERGTAVERARLRYLLYGESAPTDVREQFERGQRGDGGWSPPWATEYSSVDATCFQLAQADQLGFDRRSPLFIDAVRFLAERQRADGYWEEETEVADAAPVSYTHLDVYKRQQPERGSGSGGARARVVGRLQ